MRPSSWALGVALSLVVLLSLISFAERDTISDMIHGGLGPSPQPTPLQAVADVVESKMDKMEVSGQIFFEPSSSSSEHEPVSPPNKVMAAVDTVKQQYTATMGEAERLKTRVVGGYRHLAYRTRLLLVSVTLLVVVVAAAVAVGLTMNRMVEERRMELMLEEQKPFTQRVNDFFCPPEQNTFNAFISAVSSIGFVVKGLVILAVVLVVVLSVVHHQQTLRDGVVRETAEVCADAGEVFGPAFVGVKNLAGRTYQGVTDFAVGVRTRLGL